jgi:DNA-binding CsgD family transcriptional regulator
MLTPPPEAPTPILPMGAGGPPPRGPPRRAAGRVSSAPRDAATPEQPTLPEARDLATSLCEGGLAAVIEADPLLRLHVLGAAREIGFLPVEAEGGAGGASAPPAALFVGLDTVDACPRCGLPGGRRPMTAATLVIGYSAGVPELLAAHRLHVCCDAVLELCAVAGEARFAYPPATGLVDRARLTPREADVLVLVLAGRSTAEVAERLCIATATARTHCRALLRKFGAADRRALRARLLRVDTGPSAAKDHGAVGGSPQRFAQPLSRSLPRNGP